jgi:hypothetical protein
VKSDLAIPIYGAAAALVLILIVEWLPSSEPVVPVLPPAAHTHGAGSDAESVAKDTQAWANTIVDRPLFTVGRKPPKQGPGNHQVASSGLPRLSGIMITGFGRRAIFMPDGGKALTLGEGATLDDYTIRQIAADRVVLTGAKGDMVLRPAYDAAHAGEGFQPTAVTPGFPQPGFQPPGFNGGFRPPGFQAPQPPPPANANDDDNDDTPAQSPPQAPPQPFPGFHGPFIPRGRGQ